VLVHDEPNRDRTQIVNKDAALQNFLQSHPRCLASPHPNTTIQFKIADTSTPLVAIIHSYRQYLFVCPQWILRLGQIYYKNLRSTSLDPTVLTEVSTDLNLHRIREVLFTFAGGQVTVERLLNCSPGFSRHQPRTQHLYGLLVEWCSMKA
jgi:hypothetical protein